MRFTWTNMIKKLIALDGIWGGRSKKLAGINDFNNLTAGIFTFTSGTNTITFPGQIPEWAVENKYFRVTVGGGSNNSSLLRVLSVDFNAQSVIVYESLNDFTGTATLDARLWVAINDPMIARSTSTGSTMFNVHNRNSTGRDDASGIGFVFAEHYHDEPVPDADEGEIVTHIRNEIGGKHMSLDSCDCETKVEIGPLIVVDRQGNVVKAKVYNPYDPCYTPQEECY